MKNKINHITTIIAGCLAFVMLVSFSKSNGEPIASTTRITDGKTEGIATSKQFNAGEEIYVYIPLKNALGSEVMIRLEAEGKSPYANSILCYKAESKLEYLSFALAIDPKNHRAEEYFYKEGQYAKTTRLLSSLAPGKYKISFGTVPGLAMAYSSHISLTVNVTEEGSKKWQQWAEELDKMDKEYAEKLKKE